MSTDSSSNASPSQPEQNPMGDRLIDMVAQSAGREEPADDRRQSPRFPYNGLVGLIMLTKDGERGEPMVVRSVEIGSGGISIIARKSLTPGSRGVMQFVRTNGRTAIVGIQVSHCEYVGQMRHRTGMAFTALPESLRPEQFLDDRKRLPLFDPLLAENITTAA